jgi:hypothetical protein
MTKLIEFVESGNDTTSYIGGGSWIPSNFPWPMYEGKKMIPFMTIFQDIFVAPTIPEGMAITVFTPIDLNSRQTMYQIDNCVISDEIGYNNYNYDDGMRVILHEIGDKELIDKNITNYPKIFLKTKDLTIDDENSYFQKVEEGYIETNGIYASKVLGNPYWLQDQVYGMEKYTFALQIIGYNLSDYNSSYDGIFMDGMCYLLLDNNLWKMSHGQTAGICFIQYT